MRMLLGFGTLGSGENVAHIFLGTDASYFVIRTYLFLLPFVRPPGASTVGDDGRPTRVVGANVGYSFLAWFLIWACLAGGTKWTGRITYFTMGLPIILLFVFLGKAVSLTGSSAGIEE